MLIFVRSYDEFVQISYIGLKFVNFGNLMGIKDLIHLAFKSAHWTMKTFVCPNERLICMCIDITITPCCDKGKLHIFINEHTHRNVCFFVSMLY